MDIKSRKDIKKSEDFYKSALAIYEQEFAGDSPRIANVQNNMALLYCRQSRYKEAEQLFKSAIDIYNRKLGSEDPKTITSRNNLAELYKRQGRNEEAEQLLQDNNPSSLRSPRESMVPECPPSGMSTTSSREASSSREAGESRSSQRREGSSWEERQKLEREQKAMQDERQKLEQERKAIQDEMQKLERLRMSVATRTSGEGSSSRRTGDSRSTERSRLSDGRTDSRKLNVGDLLGRTLGNYHLVDRLGKGAFGAVYLGNHTHLDTQAAIKVLHDVDAENPEKFLQEARMLAKLKHSHIVRIHDFDVKDGIPYMVMDYVRHGSLEKAHPLGTRVSPGQVAIYLRPIAKALDYAHNQNVVHRDIKPANLLLERKPNGEKTILVGDFGLAQIFQNTTSRRTQEEIAGTFAYMAPEQIQRKPGPKSDQYALGVVIYQWVSGHLPFRGTLPEIMAQHMMMPPEPIAGIGQEIQKVVFRALEKDPTKRFESVTKFYQAFDRALGLESGRQHLRSGRYQAALDEFNRLFGLDEHDTFVLVSRGQTYQAMGKKKEALNDYRKAVNLGIQDSELLRSVMAALNELR